jgi:hypothetical protein
MFLIRQVLSFPKAFDFLETFGGFLRARLTYTRVMPDSSAGLPAAAGRAPRAWPPWPLPATQPPVWRERAVAAGVLVPHPCPGPILRPPPGHPSPGSHSGGSGVPGCTPLGFILVFPFLFRSLLVLVASAFLIGPRLRVYACARASFGPRRAVCARAGNGEPAGCRAIPGPGRGRGRGARR